MQEYDSDEDDAQKAPKKATDGPQIVRTVSAPAAPKAKVAVPVAGAQVISALMKKEAVRDRPVSAQRFREISATDSEMKVLYRYSNFRRMPMTTEQVCFCFCVIDNHEILKFVFRNSGCRIGKTSVTKN
jgi:hypothetical protein